jgi:hypothetical protein
MRISLYSLFILLFFYTAGFAASRGFAVTDEELNEFISFSDTTLHSAYLKIYGSNDIKDYFILNNISGKNYFVPDGYFIKCVEGDKHFTLMNVSHPAITFGDRLYPFLHPHFFIKFIYLLDKLKFSPRVSDMMRTYDEQMLYLKRQWSNVESSPHMTGMAGDMVYCSSGDKEYLQSVNDMLRVRYLEHGKGGNRHVHIQDNELWKTLDTSSVRFTCEKLSSELNRDKFVRDNPFKEYSRKGSGHGTPFAFYTDKLDVVKIVIEDNLGAVKAEISCGVFEPGLNEIAVNPLFLNPGVYQFKYYINGAYSSQKVVAVK